MATDSSSSSTGLKGALSKIADTIGDAASDLSSLDVLTLSGNLKLIINDKGQYLKPKEIIEAYGSTSGEITVEAFYHIDFDSDTVQYAKDGLEADDFMYQLHVEAIESAKESRQALLTFMKELL